MKFTVLLHYPDYLSDGNHETYLAHVIAATSGAAVEFAYDDAFAANPEAVDPYDFTVLAVFEGHLEDLYA